MSYEDLSFQELKAIAKEMNVKGYTKMNKEELIKNIEEADKE